MRAIPPSERPGSRCASIPKVRGRPKGRYPSLVGPKRFRRTHVSKLRQELAQKEKPRPGRPWFLSERWRTIGCVSGDGGSQQPAGESQGPMLGIPLLLHAVGRVPSLSASVRHGCPLSISRGLLFFELTVGPLTCSAWAGAVCYGLFRRFRTKLLNPGSAGRRQGQVSKQVRGQNRSGPTEDSAKNEEGDPRLRIALLRGL